MFSSLGSLREHWYALGLRRQFKAPLNPIEVDGIKLILCRFEQGYRVFEDRCPHRLYPLSQSKNIKTGLRCGYHGWEFDHEGLVTKIPATDPRKACPFRLRLKSFPVAESGGILWIWLGVKVPQHGPQDFHQLSQKGFRTQNFSRDLRANLPDLIENFLDSPHTSILHPGLIRGHGSQDLKHHQVELAFHPQSIKATYRPCEATKIGPFQGVFGGEKVIHTDEFHLPSVVVSSYDLDKHKAFKAFIFLTPLSAGQTRVIVKLATKLGFWGPLARLLLLYVAPRVIAQDARALAHLSANKAYFPQAKYIFPAHEGLHRAIHSYWELLTQGETIPERPTQSYDIWL